MSFWNTLRVGMSGLSAQRLRLDVIANNVANAETTRTEEGGPYRRKDVVFTPQGQDQFLPGLVKARRTENASPNALLDVGGVRVSEVITDDEELPKVYDPSHPDADEEGFVTYPNVNIVVEMTNMLSATRSYEANLSIIEAAKSMALRALDIGR
ncbi:MAG: flagellar basal body rod protein FlgC [Chloroflexi bacterium]|nr:MAG: flagellar basal body rod protein FlgC [Chloroflexota bacterium]MBL1194845.1 flagellar basal body rod protein FlgC [Chloroflexota bacterium]NOH12136.1 flagellar basal body rod protein FlgC [Chloroflexota bacterium]